MTAASVTVRRGRLLLERAVYEGFFRGLECVVLLRDGVALLILPVHHQAAGGYLIKIRNAAGDRVVDAADFLRAHGIDDADQRVLPVAWDPARAALVAESAFSPSNAPR